jgi:hypothetical protein
MKIARFLVTPEFLRQILHLPIGTEVTWAGMDHSSYWPCIELTIEHPDLRDVELVADEHPPLIEPQFHREGDVVLMTDWGQT